MSEQHPNMALKYDCGQGWWSTSFAREDLGADVYLYCPGPSLAAVDDKTIHVPGAYTAAINTAYPHIRPDIWFGMDHVECYDRRVWSEPFIKICRQGREEESVAESQIKKHPQTYWVTCKDSVNMEYLFEAKTHDAQFAWFKHTLGVTLHILVWMGAKRIHFVGCDMDNSTQDYHDSSLVLRKEDHDENASLYQNLANGFIPAFVRVGKKHGVECISCTLGSPLNKHMPYQELEHALEATAAKHPTVGGEILNCRDVVRKELAQWGDATDAPMGIVTCCDQKFEALLKWWYGNVRRWTDMPIFCLDLGMSPEAHAWAAKRMHLTTTEGTLLHPDGVETFGVRYGWKPFALLRAPFQKILYLDLDCEVVADPSVILNVVYPSGKNSFGICEDQLYHNLKTADALEPGEKMRQAGVIACTHGNQLVVDWANRILEGVIDWRVDDQHMLSGVLHHREDWLSLPPQCNVLAPYKGNWRDMVDKVAAEPIILHRLTSHPATLRHLQTIIDDSFCVAGAWMRDAKIMEQCHWLFSEHPEPEAQRGVVIGVDQRQLWQLTDWWLARYIAAGNDYPVLVADFGLGEQGRAVVEKLGLMLTHPIHLEAHGSFAQAFKKPLGCLCSLFRQTIWLDTDCQVNGDLAPLFEYSEAGQIGITYDRGTPQKFKDAMPWDARIYNSGCISFRHGDPLIQKWAMLTVLMCTLEPQEGKLLCPCGDQETLALAIRQYGAGRIAEIPKEQMALRLGGDPMPPDCLVKHWTGPVGKQEIKRQIAEGKQAIDPLTQRVKRPTETLVDDARKAMLAKHDLYPTRKGGE